jgi:REP element-mobilizing transposase RayT
MRMRFCCTGRRRNCVDLNVIAATASHFLEGTHLRAPDISLSDGVWMLLSIIEPNWPTVRILPLGLSGHDHLLCDFIGHPRHFWTRPQEIRALVQAPWRNAVRMGYPRKSLVCLNDTPYYHVVARCVRRAWLWGVDEYAGRDYSHRKQWVIDRLELLATIFAINICAYAVMSNHYHLVLHVDVDRIRSMSAEEIVARWSRLFRVPTIVKRWQEGIADDTEVAVALEIIERWRARLIDVSWFMRSLNEYLARRANAEDGCSGRFWEGRFKSQALLDEAGLLTAMAYVDLNPVRAGIAATPEESEFTSIYARIQALRPAQSSTTTAKCIRSATLFRFRDEVSADAPAIPFTLQGYLELLDWSGRSVRPDKRGAIDEQAPPILTRLSIDPGVWRDAMAIRGNVFGRALGRLDHLRLHAKALDQQRIKGLLQAQRLYRTV